MKKAKVVIPKSNKRADGSWVSKMQGDWLPLPEEALEQLGWVEGTELELVPIMGDSHVTQIIIRRKDSAGASREPK